jgi:hypothetical protein
LFLAAFEPSSTVDVDHHRQGILRRIGGKIEIKLLPRVAIFHVGYIFLHGNARGQRTLREQGSDRQQKTNYDSDHVCSLAKFAECTTFSDGRKKNSTSGISTIELQNIHIFPWGLGYQYGNICLWN